jgi:hypothetical protein
MKTLQQILVCCLLATLNGLAVATILVVRAIPGEVRDTRAELVKELETTRADLNRQIQSGIVRSERQASLLRAGVLTEAGEMRLMADRRLGDTLARADVALATAADLRQDLKPTLDHSAAITAQVNNALPLFLDCDHNPDCAFNRYVGASKGIERAAMNVGQATTDVRLIPPGMLNTWDQIGRSVAGTATNVDRLTKPRWYDRLLGYGLNGIVIYRNLNPVTNFTTKGAQILSGRP